MCPLLHRRQPLLTSVLFQAIWQTKNRFGTCKGRGIPHSRARALEVAWFAFVKDVLQLGAYDSPEERIDVGRVVVLPDYCLAKLIPWRNKS